MELYQLEYFCTLYEYKHFGKAAEKLHISPATLTIAIKKLERELEFPIIDRNTFTLTAVGDALLKTSQRILGEMSAFKLEVEEIKKKKRVIRLGVEAFFFTKHFAELLGTYLLEHSDMEVWLKRHSGSNVEHNLLTGEATLGIIIEPAVKDKSFVYRDFCSVEYGMFMAEENPLARCNAITPETLEDPSVKIVNLIEDIVQPIKDYFSTYHVTWHTGGVTDKDNERVKKLVSNDMGMAIMPLDMELSDNTVIRPFDPPLIINYVFVNVRDDMLNKETQQLIKYLKANW